MDAIERHTAARTVGSVPHPSSSRADIVGFLLGGAIPAIAMAIGLAADPPIATLALAGMVGVPLGLVLGSVHGIAAREAGGRAAFDLAIRMALQAVVVGDLVIGTLYTIGFASGGLEWLFLGFIATVAALLVLGIPALAFTIVCTLTWTVVLRAMPARLVGDGDATPA